MRRPYGVGAGHPAGERAALRRFVIMPSRLAMVAMLFVVLPLRLAGLSIPIPIQAIPLAVSLLAFGLPHGAVDHLVVRRLLGWPAGWRPVSRIATVYLLLAGGYLALWATMPVLAFGLFIALTWYHWGQGDLEALLATDGPGSLPTNRQRALTLIVRGGLPMLVPLLAAPGIYREVMDAAVGVFRPGNGSGTTWVFEDRTRLVAGIIFGAIVLLTVVMTRPHSQRQDRRAWRTSVAETVLLAAAFAVVPPVLAIGIYFCCWHATRHIARMILLGSSTPPEARSRWLAGALAHFALEAALPTVGALALLAGLFVVPGASGGTLDLTGLYLVGLAILTLPHTMVVTWLDWRQGVWRAIPHR